MNRPLAFSLVSVLSFSATTAFAGPYAELMASLSANKPRAMCLGTADGCKTLTSDSFKAMRSALDDQGAPVAVEFALYGQSLVGKAKKVVAVTSKYQQARIRAAAESAVAAVLKGYDDAYGPARVEAGLLAVAGTLGEAIRSFEAIEAEAAKVTAGREAYLRARESDFARVSAKVDAAMGSLAALAGGEKYVADAMNASLPADPRAVFVAKCDFNPIFDGAVVDLVADYDFIARLTNARNLTIECKDTTENFMGIGESSSAKYAKKAHVLKFFIGDAPTGNWNSKSAYDYTEFGVAYHRLKQQF